MAYYDYVAGKKRVEEILDNKLEIIYQDKVPSDDEFTFINGYYSWVTGLFVDIRDSSTLFSNEDNETISKIIRSLTSEVIDILLKDDNLREIGIRGDCVYAIYTTPTKGDIYEVADKSFYVNTYMGMLNNLLLKRNYPTIKVGIGVATAKELVVKAGRKNSGINNKVWIGDAVAKASNLSSLGNKSLIPPICTQPIVYSELSYLNFIEQLVNNSGEQAKSWFKKEYSPEHNFYYHADVVITNFNDWIHS